MSSTLELIIIDVVHIVTGVLVRFGVWPKELSVNAHRSDGPKFSPNSHFRLATSSSPKLYDRLA